MGKQKPYSYVTEDIRQIPVVYLLNLETKMLNELEKKVRDEVRRTSLALKWVRGIKRIKHTHSSNGGYNG